MGEPEQDLAVVRLNAWVRGRVQGVGFRWWTRARALELGLVGSASNLDDGRVEVVAEGTREACEALLEALRSELVGPGAEAPAPEQPAARDDADEDPYERYAADTDDDED